MRILRRRGAAPLWTVPSGYRNCTSRKPPLFSLKTSENFCFHYTSWQHGKPETETAAFPVNTPIYRRTKEKQPVQFPYNFQPAAPFGAQKKGERERCVKGLPAQGRAGIVENHSHSYQNNSCAPLKQRESSPKLRTPKGAAEKFRGYTDLVVFSLAIQVLYGQHSLQKRLPCGIINAQTSRKVSYHGEVIISDCGNKMRGSSRAQRVAPDVS